MPRFLTPKKGLRYAIAIACLFLGMLAFKANAAAPFSESFDGLNTAALNGQNSWTASGSNVQSATAKSGKAADCTGATCYLGKGGSDYDTAIGTWYMWVKSPLPTGENYRLLSISRYGVGTQAQVRIYADGSNLKFCAHNGTTCSTGFDPDDWHYLKIDWDTTEYRFSVDWGSDSADVARLGSDVVNTIQWANNNPQDGTFYVDEISGTQETAPDSIAITEPADGAERTEPLTHWEVTYSVNATTTDLATFRVVTSATQADVLNSTASTSDACVSTVYTALPELSAIGVVANLCVLDLATTYYAKAFLGIWDGDDYTSLAVSDPIDFSLGEYIATGNATTSQTFYNSNVPAFFATTTPSVIYTGLTGTFNAILTPVFTVLQWFGSLFDNATAQTNGTDAGESLALLFAYLNEINTLFGIPIVTIICFGIILEIAAILWAQSHKAIKTVK